MVTRNTLTEEQAKAAIAEKEFPESVRSASDYVAVVLTQGWCPQWVAMKTWLRGMEKKGAPDLDVVTFELVYDKVAYSTEFQRFKETVLGNSLIPYVRYYYRGSLIHESNYVSGDTFLDTFRTAEQ